ncbi:efflux RND transporter periplasmic adaptor subunit [methanotrophic endosymbiont of Bathymodiolus puteoserpentis (Logatchev)]|uniref:efflux RND transporter periplasmic adaptor subunit n=1 Tax=methanotrophic endosymbiont of Bathymodiolus puteoserpentis (Logatchev) TaxID=343235 RepID=UPI0013C942A2|nr:efflux RND transporter periplasmic adaptor subunit [methanotrophic endosymbiont of Bathymodiolus puteoserpentis (Logatchev)]SHE23129.1 Probable Co/Zn/Cd efflux system membrane fusion protein [methanotrophic endosymbiont of Bathymodiolus puteoserpentis (Logatchev)]
MKALSSLTAFFLCYMSLTGCTNKPDKQAEKPPRPVEVRTLSSGTDDLSAQFTGVLQAAERANLAFRVPGQIEAILVKEGESVKKGELLARLDPHDFQISVGTFEANLLKAEAAYQFALVHNKRVNTAALDNAIAAIKLEQSEAELAAASANIKVIKQGLQRAKNALSYTRLLAPFAGVVGNVKPKAYEQVLPGVPVITLQQQGELEVVVDVPERLLHRFSIGKQGTVHWQGSERKIPAKVTEISSVAGKISRTYDVTMRFSEATTDLVPGKSVFVDIPLLQAQMKHIFCVPYESILLKGKQASIFVVTNHIARQHTVKIMHTLQDQVCIQGNLQGDETIVSAGVHFLEEGQQVGKLISAE